TRTGRSDTHWRAGSRSSRSGRRSAAPIQSCSTDTAVTAAHSGRIDRTLSTAPPEALFLLSAISQYIGAAIAVSLFDEVEPQTVAWFRVMGASIALLAISPGFWRGWTRRHLAGAAIFGT